MPEFQFDLEVAPAAQPIKLPARRRSVFDAPPIGIKRFKQIVEDVMIAKAHRKGNAKAGASGQQLRILFKRYDADGSGDIDKGEFTAMLLDCGIRRAAQSDVDALFDHYDADHSGSLEYGEFAQAFTQGVSDEKGIIDFPSEHQGAGNQFKTDHEKVHMLNTDAWAKWGENKMTPAKFATMVEADESGMASAKKMLEVVSSKLRMGVGNRDPLDKLLKGKGRTNVNAFLSQLLPGLDLGTDKVQKSNMQKFRRKASIFNAQPIGLQRVKKIVEDKFAKHSHKKGYSKGGSSTQQLQMLFKLYDTDRSGDIDVEEFTAMLLDLGIRQIHQSDVDELFNFYDADGSGSLEYGEFADAFAQGVSDEKGIIDLPSEQESAGMKHKSEAERMHILQTDAWDKWNEYQMTPAKFAKMCDTEDDWAKTQLVTAVVTSKLRIGLGNRFHLDQMLATTGKYACARGGKVQLSKLLGHLLPGLDKQKVTVATATAAQGEAKPKPAVRNPMQKFKRKASIFDAQPIGLARIRKIVEDKFHKHSHKKGYSAGGASAMELKKLFKQWDPDGSGSIDKSEFTAMLLDLGIRQIHQSDVDELFNFYDADNSGDLGYNEFCDAFAKGISDVKGIIDLPSELDAETNKYKTPEERMILLQIDANTRWQEYRMDAAKFASMCKCDKHGMAPLAEVEGVITSKLRIGLGNRTPLDLIFAHSGPHSCVTAGKVDIGMLLQKLGFAVRSRKSAPPPRPATAQGPTSPRALQPITAPAVLQQPETPHSPEPPPAYGAKVERAKVEQAQSPRQFAATSEFATEPRRPQGGLPIWEGALKVPSPSPAQKKPRSPRVQQRGGDMQPPAHFGRYVGYDNRGASGDLGGVRAGSFRPESQQPKPPARPQTERKSGSRPTARQYQGQVDTAPRRFDSRLHAQHQVQHQARLGNRATPQSARASGSGSQLGELQPPRSARSPRYKQPREQPAQILKPPEFKSRNAVFNINSFKLPGTQRQRPQSNQMRERPRYSDFALQPQPLGVALQHR
jgi:Ca2+-binding EF-hand superfamily protein